MAAPVLDTVRPGVAFVAPAAASFRRLEADLGRRADVNSSYRDYNLQLGMYNAWRRYVLSGYKPSLKPWHSQAIHPDASMHCKGLAMDSDDWTTPGFNALAAEHGWIRTAASDPTERHHFEYRAASDRHRNRPAGNPGKDITPPKRKKLPMAIGFIKRIGTPKNDAIYVLDLEVPGAPLRQIGWAEYTTGLAQGVVLNPSEVLNGKHPFDDLVRERGILMADGLLRPIPFAAKPNPGPGYDLLDWRGFAVSRPKG